MADEQQVDVQAKTPGALAKAGGALVSNPQNTITAGAITLMVIEIFRGDPKDGFGFFATFGAKYVLWMFLSYILWDVIKRAITVLNKGADNIGRVATAVDAVATKQDRQAEELRLQCSYAASSSDRAVELGFEAVRVGNKAFAATEANTDMLREVLSRLPGQPKEVSS
jgi:hypothetical protein